MNWLTVLYLIAGFLSFCYFLMLGIQAVSWSKIPVFRASGQTCKTTISIIIAMRNEESNIVSCLRSIIKQNYPAELFEVIIIDDHSSDNSVQEVKNLIQEPSLKINIRLIELKNSLQQNSYKKYAISEGIKTAKGELIITTDADCESGKNWLHTIASYYEKHLPVLMMCPVSFKTGRSLFSKMQSLEFLGLIGMGAATNHAGFPLMCNGANLAYSKKAFEAISGYGQTPMLASGDDTFLMFKMKDKYPGGIHFVKALDANVTTTAQSSLAAFFQQRKRWASKTTYYKKNYVTFTGIMIYFFNFFLLFTGLLGITDMQIMLCFIFMLTGKLIFEFLFMALVCKFYRQEKLLSIFLPTSFMFTPYILCVGLLAPFGTYQWKGRKVR